jgi:hypothetical protein
LELHIPAPVRRGHFISPNTKLITVSVQPMTASPWPSPLPLQKLLVKAPTPCTIPSSGGYDCSFSISALLGEETFALKTYASADGSGQPLSIAQSGIVNVGNSQPSLAFTLEGVVHDVVLGVPSPEPGTAATYAVPIASPTAMPLTVTPRDASGASILTSTFATPIALSVSPSNLGITLALTSHCPGDTAPFTGTKIVLTCASDLPYVDVAYDGSIVRKGGQIVESATISPSFGSATATLALGSGEQIFETQGGGGSGPMLSAGPDGRIYFLTPGSPPVLGSFDPANPTGTLKQATLSFAASTIFVDSKDQIWLAGAGILDCLTSVKSTLDGSVAVGYLVDGITQSQKTIWYAGQNGSQQGVFGYVNQPTNCSGLPVSATAIAQIGSGVFTPSAIAPAGLSGGAPAIWIGAYSGSYDGQLFTGATSSQGQIFPNLDFTANFFTAGMASDPSFNAYVALPGGGSATNPQEVLKVTPATYVSQPVFTPPPFMNPLGVAVYSGSLTTAQQVAVADGGGGYHSGVDLVDVSGATPVPFYLPWTGSSGCYTVAFDASGGVWAGCIDAAGKPAIFHPVYTSRWSVVSPDISVNNYTFPNYSALAILEKPGTDSSPFTGVLDPSGGSAAVPGSGAYPWPPGYTHDVPVYIQIPGVSEITVTDKNGRSQTIDIKVTGTDLTVRPGPRRR